MINEAKYIKIKRETERAKKKKETIAARSSAQNKLQNLQEINESNKAYRNEDTQRIENKKKN